jgi:putative Holliday junction resolvase
MSRILALDWGERRVGVAISDPEGIIATGLETLVVKSPEHAANRIAEIAREREADRIVVGLPLLMSGQRGEAADAAERFAALIGRRTGLPVETYDERLTSALSERRLRETGVRGGQQRGRVDQGAAVALLESYLMRLKARWPAPDTDEESGREDEG